MSDLFHEAVPDSYIRAVFEVMKIARWHTFQVLTKRAVRLRNLLSSSLREAAEYDHIWWGVSVENKKHGLPRIEYLQQAKIPIRFLSIEPLLEHLGSVNLCGISWVIVGGESGPGARPMEKEWVVSIQKQCGLAGVPFFFKQWGGVWKARTGRRLNGRIYDEQPKLSSHPIKPLKERLEYAAHIESSLCASNRNTEGRRPEEARAS